MEIARKRSRSKGLSPVREMAGHSLLAVIGSSILAFVFIVGIRVRKTRRREMVNAGDPFVTGKVQNGWESDGSGGPDVIVVGAGVAGSALAYTLGKVMMLFPVDRPLTWLVRCC